MTADDWKQRLALQPHPEGGWFRETHRASESIAREALPQRFSGARAFSTAIYYLLAGKDFSALHRIQQEEAWHFYDGAPLTLHLISPTGQYATKVLSCRGQADEEPQAVVPAGWLFAATVAPLEPGFCLVGCTVAPGFDFADFTMPSREELLRQYPQLHDTIVALTRV